MKLGYYSSLREAVLVMLRPWLIWRCPLKREDLKENPTDQFKTWFGSSRFYPSQQFNNAMCLSTISPAGYPEGRMVLLKSYNDTGFVFYTNYESNKGVSLDTNGVAALTIYWGAQQRQVRIRGRVERILPEDSDRYFSSRPRSSQLGAWASAQSRVIASRSELMERVREVKTEFKGCCVPRPAFWGGYRLIPEEYEFLQIRLSRLHDRFRYRKLDAFWVIERLAP